MDGILIIDKPAGWTSHDVVARVRRLLRTKRVGHTGTLDPFATGVLVVLLGRATRLAQIFSGAIKEYEATVRFGFATDTGDLTGEPRATPEIADSNCAWSAEQIEAALRSLRGSIEQVPPMYSAKKIEGRKLYEYARRGVEVERKAVTVRIYELEAIGENNALLRGNAEGTCDLRIRVRCSAGTYIRALAEQIGGRLNAGAHLAALRRTRAGEFSLECAISLDELRKAVEGGAEKNLVLSSDAALSHLPFVHLTERQVGRACHGMAAPVESAGVDWKDGELVRMRDGNGNLIALGEFRAEKSEVQPRVLFADPGD